MPLSPTTGRPAPPGPPGPVPHADVRAAGARSGALADKANAPPKARACLSAECSAIHQPAKGARARSDRRGARAAAVHTETLCVKWAANKSLPFFFRESTLRLFDMQIADRRSPACGAAGAAGGPMACQWRARRSCKLEPYRARGMPRDGARRRMASRRRSAGPTDAQGHSHHCPPAVTGNPYTPPASSYKLTASDWLSEGDPPRVWPRSMHEEMQASNTGG